MTNDDMHFEACKSGQLNDVRRLIAPRKDHEAVVKCLIERIISLDYFTATCGHNAFTLTIKLNLNFKQN